MWLLEIISSEKFQVSTAKMQEARLAFRTRCKLNPSEADNQNPPVIKTDPNFEDRTRLSIHTKAMLQDRMKSVKYESSDIPQGVAIFAGNQ